MERFERKRLKTIPWIRLFRSARRIVRIVELLSKGRRIFGAEPYANEFKKRNQAYLLDIP